MRVASTVRYIFHLPYLTKRPERSIWKGKGIDNSPSVEVTVHCHNDDSQSTGFEMAVNASELDLHHGCSSNSSGSRSRLVRVVSWASIVCDKCRWTAEQERELAVARSELGRCQKAWSSEQELWLSYVRFIFPLPFLVSFASGSIEIWSAFLWIDKVLILVIFFGDRIDRGLDGRKRSP
ncbi:hypothetical protein BDV38DRAFT_244701 [Aspergillus pseudotamarii]|uniref:Uncharacterized protein n=1 Tax=Aspergillus pseudotamarii TaxID=132259 RepID=A0A5N6SUU7_ASPPS|nr:uncharacterized protein BDV38DRAFT_244701 [Aspergillus pseudotamarii]KAE8138458.1 hypothetical protein BDV38DRAFT_244701 [Aspergillus pseudotamarii]